jgi:hypothetical protein
MKLNILCGVILLLSAILFLGCDQRKPIQPEWDRTGKELRITINTYQSLSAMQQVVGDRVGSEQPQGLQGFAIMSPDDNVCEVFIVQPDRIDDKHTLTLGHEVLHCLYGRYHRE